MYRKRKYFLVMIDESAFKAFSCNGSAFKALFLKTNTKYGKSKGIMFAGRKAHQ